MAQQAKKKAARQPRRSDKATAGSSVARDAVRGASAQGAELSARIEELECERDEALRQLAKAQQRIKELEDTQDQVVNRIDWVIDSLHSLKQDTP